MIDGADGDWDEGVVLAGGGGIEETFDDLFGGVFAGLFDGDGATKLEVTHDPSFLYVHVRTAKPWDGAPFTIEFAPAEPVDAAAGEPDRRGPGRIAPRMVVRVRSFPCPSWVTSDRVRPHAEDAEGWNPVRLLTARVQNAPVG